MPIYQPDWTIESQIGAPVCGIDEAGRGPLAGPVIAAAVILSLDSIPEGINDSKALSRSRREYLVNRLYTLAKFNKIRIGIGVAEPEEIDRINILAATMKAMSRAVTALPGPMPVAALIDGNRAPEDLPCSARTVIKGDQKSLSIAAASIIAKTYRDQIMREAALRFPVYGFEAHKGYPTRRHINALEHYGPCPVHRRSFNRVRPHQPQQKA